MHASTAISSELAQAKITDLHRQAGRASVARAAHAEPEPRKPLVHGRLRFRPAGRHRVTTAIG